MLSYLLWHHYDSVLSFFIESKQRESVQFTHRKNETVFEVWISLIALFTSEMVPILHDLLVAIFFRAGLCKRKIIIIFPICLVRRIVIWILLVKKNM